MCMFLLVRAQGQHAGFGLGNWVRGGSQEIAVHMKVWDEKISLAWKSTDSTASELGCVLKCASLCQGRSKREDSWLRALCQSWVCPALPQGSPSPMSLRHQSLEEQNWKRKTCHVGNSASFSPSWSHLLQTSLKRHCLHLWGVLNHHWPEAEIPCLDLGQVGKKKKVMQLENQDNFHDKNNRTEHFERWCFPKYFF